MTTVKPIPDGYPRVIPYLTVDGATAAIEFYVKVLGAKERMRMDAPGGKIGHAELEIGESLIMLADPFGDPDAPLTPGALGGSPVTVMVYVTDVDAVHRGALEAGATELSPVQDQFYGDRSGVFQDPFGHRWHLATHIEDVPADEMARRMAAAMG
jgi:PhnB protein